MALAAVADPNIELSGIQRAAILVMYLEGGVAKKLLAQMKDAEIRAIGLAMATVQRVAPSIIEKVVSDFVKDLFDVTMMPRTGKEFALDILPDLVEEYRRVDLAGAIKRRLSTEFEEYITTRPPRAVKAILQDEHPQTQAVALQRMGSSNAARIMTLMDAQEQYELTLRMARLKEIPGELSDEVEDAIRYALEQEASDRFAIEGMDTTAQVLGQLGKPSNEKVLLRLSKLDRNLSDRLRRRMVTFDDLDGIDDRAVQSILKEVDREDLLMALKGTKGDQLEMFLRNMSSRAAADIRDELEIMGPTPKSMVDRAQENIVEVALRLSEEGSIFLSVGNSEEMM